MVMAIEGRKPSLRIGLDPAEPPDRLTAVRTTTACHTLESLAGFAGPCFHPASEWLKTSTAKLRKWGETGRIHGVAS